MHEKSCTPVKPGVQPFFALLAGLDEGAEDSRMVGGGGLIPHALGMPLNPDAEGMPGELNGFNDAIRRDCGDDKACAGFTDRLMVVGVDGNGFGLENGAQERIGSQGDRV